jgi:hypothetical protein
MRSKQLHEATAVLNDRLSAWRSRQLGTTPAGKAFTNAITFEVRRLEHPLVVDAVVAKSEHIRKGAFLEGYICVDVSHDGAGKATIKFQRYYDAPEPIVLY